MITRGFTGRQQSPDIAKRLPPGQSLTADFPVLSEGPTPHISTDDGRSARDIHAHQVEAHTPTESGRRRARPAGIEPPTKFILAHSFDRYSTNVPVTDLVGGKAMIALRYDGKPLAPDHGGPARLLVPHLYFWKSAKWVSGLQFTTRDEPGFWELRGYHIYGDPWREQRFTGN